MKQLIYVSLIVTFQLSTIGHSYANGNCEQGMRFDTSLNRCLTTQQVQEIRVATTGCMQLSTQEEKKACYISEANKQLAASDVKDIQEDFVSEKLQYKNGDKGAITIAAISSAVAIYTLIYSAKHIKGCKSTALWMMLGGAVAAVGSEITAWLMYKNGLKKLNEEYKDLAGNNDEDSSDARRVDATNAQSEAFEYLAKKEDLTKKVANTKGGVYALAGALYTGAAILSGIESYRLITGDDTGICTAIGNNNGDQAMKKGVEEGAKKGSKSLIGKGLKALFGGLLLGAATKGATSLFKKKKTSFSIEYEDYKKDKDDFNFYNRKRDSEFMLKNVSKIAIHEYMATQELISFLKGDTLSPSVKGYNALLDTQEELEYIHQKVFSFTKLKHTIVNTFASVSNFIIPSAHAQTDSVKTTDVTGGKRTDNEGKSPVGDIGSKVGIISKALVNPYTRLVLNGLFAYSTIKLSVHAFKQAKIAKERAEELRRLKLTFSETNGIVGCTPEQREIPSTTTCYCYDENNKKRTDRIGVSELCKKLWTQGGSFDSDSYDPTVADGGGPFGCVNVNNQFDEKCKCRNQKIPSGSNACFKMSPGLLNVSGLKNASWMSNLGSQTDKLLNGSMTGADLNGAALYKQAAALSKIRNKILAKIKDKKTLNKIRKANGILGPALKSYSPKTLASFNKSSSLAGFSVASAPALDSLNTKDIEKKAEAIAASASSKFKPKSKSASNNFDLGFDGGDAKGGIKVSELNVAMDKEYNFGDNDINKNSDASIFDLLTNRYQISGMRKLFEEKKKPQSLDSK
jgi:hypothetical protein